MLHKLVTLALFALLAIGCYIEVAKADPESEEENIEFQRGGGVANIFHNDVLDKGVPKLVLPDRRDCRMMPKKDQCRTCCAETNRAFIWSRDIQVLKLRLKGCTCITRVPKAE